ncbi:SpoIIE family protein phosphatase [Thermopolyspora sp. NPDC052614]|uniref:ATP-binding protein n=1 Tax=Thermopolyspora sp. NPDC052614 TaxID=3155682 RepID=UPI00342A8BD8
MVEAVHRRHDVRAEEDVGALRRAVASMAGRVPGLRLGEPELAATELATNLLRHTTGGGYVLCREADGGIELVAVDHGPGMRPGGVPPWAIARGGDAPLPRSGGGGGLGVGLAGVRRLSSVFDCYASPHGSVVLARVGSAVPPADASWRWGGVNVPRGGTGESGDAWAVSPGPRLGALVVDGLGHGPAAAEAARAAVTEFGRGYLTDIEAFVRRANEAMRGTRGGVLGVCLIEQGRDELTFAGVGNITGRVIVGGVSERLLGRGGTLGTQAYLPSAHPTTHRWVPGAALVLASDGITSRWDPLAYPNLLRRHPTVVAATLERDHGRGTDDATVLVVQDTRAQDKAGGIDRER